MRRLAALLLSMPLSVLVTGCASSGGFEEAGGCDFEVRAELSVQLERNVPLVLAQVDGEVVQLVVDTGAERTLLTESAVRRLRLGRVTDSQTQVVGVGGQTVTTDTRTRSLSLGGIALGAQTLVVGDFIPQTVNGVTPDGLLGADVLSHYDIDLDLPDGTMTLYRPRDCPQQGPAWADAAIEADSSSHGYLMLPIHLDGQTLDATLDTGSETTTLARKAAAAQLGLRRNVLRADPLIPVQGVAASTTEVRLHRFGDLRVGPLLFRRPILPISPLPDFIGDALVGVDVLRNRRVFLSWASQRIWLATGVNQAALSPAPGPATGSVLGMGVRTPVARVE